MLCARKLPVRKPHIYGFEFHLVAHESLTRKRKFKIISFRPKFSWALIFILSRFLATNINFIAYPSFLIDGHTASQLIRIEIDLLRIFLPNLLVLPDQDELHHPRQYNHTRREPNTTVHGRGEPWRIAIRP